MAGEPSAEPQAEPAAAQADSASTAAAHAERLQQQQPASSSPTESAQGGKPATAKAAGKLAGAPQPKPEDIGLLLPA